MKKNIKINLFLFLFTLLFFSCSGADIQNYQSPNFTNYDLKTIAILPIKNSYLSIGDAQEINRYFMTGISRKGLKYNIITPDDAIDKLNKDTLVEAYYEYLKQYTISGIPNTETIKKIGISLDCNAIFQGEIFDIVKTDGQFDNNSAETKCKIRYSAVSTKDGKVLWETTADAYKGTLFTTDRAPSLMDVIKIGMDEIIEGLPGNK